MTGITKLAVFGRPIGHSRSPEIHQQFAAEAGIEISYEKILVPEGSFNEIADKFLKDGTGFNITVPCKFDAYEYVATRSPGAELARAVNTISVKNGKTRGDNTDGPGLVADLKHNLGWTLESSRILVLGAGGAVSGVLADLLQASPSMVHLYNRTHAKAEELSARFEPGKIVPARASDLETGYDVIINGTSAGLAGDLPDVPGHIVAAHSCCYDMVYASQATAFMLWCKAQADCETADGLGMLVEQAALAFSIWTGHNVSTRQVIAGLRASL